MEQFVLKNPFFKCCVNEEQTKIQFLDLDDNYIIPNVLHYLQIETTVKQNEIQDVSLATFNVHIENTLSGIKVNMLGEGEFQTLNVSFILSSKTPEIHNSSNTTLVLLSISKYSLRLFFCSSLNSEVWKMLLKSSISKFMFFSAV